MENHKSHIDPVCGMRVDRTDAAGEYEHEGVMYYFDTDECMSKFYKSPEQYAGKSDKDKLSDVRQAVGTSEKSNIDVT